MSECGVAGGTVWGEVTEGPEFPAPLAFAAPGLCLLPRTRMMDDFACLMRSRGPAPFLVLPSPLPFFFFFFGSKANSTTNGVGFHFFPWDIC